LFCTLSINAILFDAVFFMITQPQISSLFPYTTLFRSYGLDNEDARLVKIEYNRGNRPPQAIASVLDSVGEETLHRTVFLTSELSTLPLASEAAGPAPLRVLFTSRGSGDPDSDDIVSSKWQLEAGATTTDPHPAHTYTQPADYYDVYEHED